MTEDRVHPSGLLQQLLDMPVEDRIQAIAKDVCDGEDKFREIDGHDLAEALGVVDPWSPGEGWSFTQYAEKQSIESYADGHDPAEIAYLIDDKVSPERLKTLLKKFSSFKDYAKNNFNFLTKKEREFLEDKIVSDELERNSSNGMNCLAHASVSTLHGDELLFEAVIEDDGACIELRTPYDFRDGRFTNLENCLTAWY